MSDPVFKLEGVIHSQGDMEDFEGPLSLILQLLSKNKIEIKDISISLILDQYLEYLREMEELDLEVASEFVAMASHLAYIKSKMLLTDDEEEISELEELISSLEKLRRKDDYVKIKGVTPVFAEMYTRGAGRIVKPPEYLPPDREYRYKHDKEDLFAAFMRLYSREENKSMLTHQSVLTYPTKVVYPVADKAKEIRDKLKEFGNISLAGLFYSCKSRSEIVAVFVSVLEMCKSGAAILTGEGETTLLCYSGVEVDMEYDDYDRGGENGNS